MFIITYITSDSTHEITSDILCQGMSGCQGSKSNPDSLRSSKTRQSIQFEIAGGVSVPKKLSNTSQCSWVLNCTDYALTRSSWSYIVKLSYFSLWQQCNTRWIDIRCLRQTTSLCIFTSDLIDGFSRLALKMWIGFCTMTLWHTLTDNITSDSTHEITSDTDDNWYVRVGRKSHFTNMTQVGLDKTSYRIGYNSM